MKQIDADSTLKIGKENKDQQEQKRKKPKNEWDWKPIVSELAFVVAKGLITGFTIHLGGKMYDSTFNRQTNNASLSIIAGGKGTSNIAV